MNDQINIARDGAQLGVWSAGDVQKMLASGVLTGSDYFFREGMTDWAPMSDLGPPETPVKLYPIQFGSGMSVDKLGFVRTGTIKVSGSTVEISGMKLWPAMARVGCFIVGTPMLWLVLGTITGLLPSNGVIFGLIKVCFGLFTVIGAPLVVMMLIRTFCASPGLVAVQKSSLSEVERTGRRVSFLAAAGAGKKRKALFRASTDSVAHEIQQALRT